LSEFGFSIDDVVTAAAKPDSVTFKLHENGVENYQTLVRYARQNKEKLLQVSISGYTYCIEADATFLEKAGFCVGDAFIAHCEHGMLHVTRLDFKQLGF
jgi:hypothetical protein